MPDKPGLYPLHTSQYQQHQPWWDAPNPEKSVEAPRENSITVPRTTCGLRRPTFCLALLLVVAVAAVIAIGAVLGLAKSK